MPIKYRIVTTPATPEVVALYAMLHEALPLALKQVGSEAQCDQWAFWSAFQELESFVSDLVDATAGHIGAIPSPIGEALEEARDSLKTAVT